MGGSFVSLGFLLHQCRERESICWCKEEDTQTEKGKGEKNKTKKKKDGENIGRDGAS